MNSITRPDLSVPQQSLAGVGRQAFLHSLSQHARLISIETPLAPGALIVQSFTGREAMSELFRFEVDCLATSAHYELKALIGEEVSLRVRLADGGTRALHGIVTAAGQLGGDGALARYRLTLEPWLHALTLRRDSYVFQDKTVLEMIEEVFRDYPLANYRFDVSMLLPKRSVAMQYRETDYDFIARLLAEEGLNFYLRHDDQDADSQHEGKAVHARHCFIVFDDNAALAPCAQPSVRFHRADATESDDTVTLFAQRRRIQANAVALSSWDYKALTANGAEDQAAMVAQDVPPLETYEGRGAYRYSDVTESARIARARAESLALQQQLFHGESSVRHFSVGAWFQLTGYSADASTEQVVLSIEHHAANNLAAHNGGPLAANAIEAGSYRNHFTCAPRAIPIRPAYWLSKPTSAGPQVALVVGVAGEEITSERDHRVKIQFPWQRGARAATGQVGHPSGSNTPGDETADTWVRVAEAAAGANWGSKFIARIGQEVLIDFIDGDIDRPVVVGQLYNGADSPPYHGADNHPGALAGIRTKEYAATGFNQWAIDDTPQQLRQSIASSYSASQLNIGYLIRENGNVRGAFRGTGFELASDAWSTLRAKRGMFVSTTQRMSATSTQLDTQEAQGKLAASAELATALSDAAAQHQTLPVSTPEGIVQLTRAITATDSADGQQARAFTQPVALLDSQAGFSTATPASSVMFAGQDLTLTAASALRMSAGQSASVAAARTASLFTYSGGAKVIAAKEAVSVRAHTGAMNVLSEQALTITSSNGSIKVQAKQEILLASGGGYIKLSGSNIDIHCPASLSVKGVTHEFKGADKLSVSSLELPEGVAPHNLGLPVSLVSPEPELYSERLLVCAPLTGESMQTSYILLRDSAVIDKGFTTGDGSSTRHIQDRGADLTALVGPSIPWAVEYHRGTETLLPIHEDV